MVRKSTDGGPPQRIEEISSPSGVAAFQYAGFWRRFAAVFIDGILLFIVGMIISFPISAITRIHAIRSGGMNPMDFSMILAGQILVGVIQIVGCWLYFALMESSYYQATLGKMLLGIKVTDLAGNRISFGKATGRYFAKFISSLTCLVGYIMAGFTEKKQALHDMIAGSLVDVKRDL